MPLGVGWRRGDACACAWVCAQNIIQGDFIQQLMVGVGDELGKAAPDISRSVLAGKLEQAIRWVGGGGCCRHGQGAGRARGRGEGRAPGGVPSISDRSASDWPDTGAGGDHGTGKL
jgi:hypothetical protein